MGLNMGLKQYAAGLSETTGPMIATLVTVFLNAAFNRAFIYGVPGACPRA